MNRERRILVLIRSSETLAKRLVKDIEDKYKIRIVKGPENSYVNVKIREEAKNSLFYPGEVFVTETKVLIEEAIGVGIVTGNRPELSYWLSIIDAAYNAELKEIDKWENILLKAENETNLEEMTLEVSAK